MEKMELEDLTREDKIELLEGLKKLRNKGPVHEFHGICSQLFNYSNNRQAYPFVECMAELWPECGQRTVLPIGDDYDSIHKWDGPFGAKRWRFVKFITEYLEAELAKVVWQTIHIDEDHTVYGFDIPNGSISLTDEFALIVADWPFEYYWYKDSGYVNCTSGCVYINKDTPVIDCFKFMTRHKIAEYFEAICTKVQEMGGCNE